MADAKNQPILTFARGFYNSGTVTNFNLNTATTRIAWVFVSATGSAITHLGVRLQSKTGTSPTYRVSLQAIGADGRPTGTVLGGGTPASATFTVTALTAGEFHWIALDNSFTPTRGTTYAVVLDYSSGTVDGSNFAAFGFRSNVFNTNASPLPLSDTTGSAWTTAVDGCGIFGYRTASSRHGFPIKNVGSTAAISADGQRGALRFVPASGTAATVQVTSGVLFLSGTIAAGSSVIWGLWTAAGAVLSASTVTVDTDALGAGSQFGMPLASTPTLTAGTAYYLGLERAGTNFSFRTITVSDANDWPAFNHDSGWCYSTWDGAAWNDSTTTRIFGSVVLSDITPPATTDTLAVLDVTTEIIVKAGSADVRAPLFFRDRTTGDGRTGLAYNTAGWIAKYRRPGADSVNIPLVSQTTTGAHTDGGFVAVDDTGMPGECSVDLPDAAVAPGVPYVVVMIGGASNSTRARCIVHLVAYDPQDTVRLGLTALPNVAQGNDGQIALGNATGQVTIGALGVGSIVTATFAPGAINATVVADGFLTAAKIADDAITNAKIADGAITPTEAPALQYLDASVSTRLDADDYEAPDNAGIATIAGYTDTLEAAAASLATAVAALDADQPYIDVTIEDTPAPTTLSFAGQSGLSASDDRYNGTGIVFVTGTLQGLYFGVKDYDGAGRLFTVEAMPVAPAAGDRAKLIGRREAE